MTFPARRTIAAALLGSTVLVSIATAQTSGNGAMDHASMTAEPQGSVLTEPGQGAFGALSEVVRVLEADPATDWSAVNLTALRNHLIDMDRLVRDAVAEEEVLPNGLRATVTGDPATLATARRMVPAHVAELSKDDRWQAEAQDNGTDVVLTVTSDDPATVARIQGLGFFGLMASRDHHREHHMAVALGG
jgi:hypothetical protein